MLARARRTRLPRLTLAVEILSFRLALLTAAAFLLCNARTNAVADEVPGQQKQLTNEQRRLLRKMSWDDLLRTEENVWSDSLVRVFRVRSDLTRLALGHVDCVVEIRRPFDGRQARFSKPLLESIAKGVESLHVAAEEKVLFRISFHRHVNIVRCVIA